MEKENALKWLTLFNELIQTNKGQLNDLDTPIGDGDHGSNMSRGMLAVMEALETKEVADGAAVFKTASMQLLAKVGGASGPLYWSAFAGIAKNLTNGATLVDSLQAGLDEIKKRGKADVGEKTMIDAWQPLIHLLQENVALTEETINQIVKATKEIKATKGRASYLGERSIGHIDPGAYSSGLFFKALLESGVMNQ